MDSNQLENFIALSKIGSFSKAEEELHITKTALKKQIDKLEEELGFQLFIRTSKGVELTTIGKEYCNTLQELLESHKHFVSIFRHRAHPSTKTIRIGLFFTSYLLDIIQKAQIATGLSFEIIMLNPMNRSLGIQMLYDGELDFLEWHDDMPDSLTSITFKVLVVDQMCCLMSPMHPLAKNEYLDFSMLKDQTVNYSVSNRKTSTELVKLGIEHGVKLHQTTTNTSEIVNTCLNNNIFILSYGYAQTFSPLKVVPLKPTISFRWGLMFKPEQEIIMRLIQIHARKS